MSPMARPPLSEVFSCGAPPPGVGAARKQLPAAVGLLDDALVAALDALRVLPHRIGLRVVRLRGRLPAGHTLDRVILVRGRVGFDTAETLLGFLVDALLYLGGGGGL